MGKVKQELSSRAKNELHQTLWCLIWLESL